MFTSRHVVVCAVLGSSCLALSFGRRAEASIIHHVYNYTTTVAGDPTAHGAPIDLAAGTVGGLGDPTPAVGFRIIPSNSGRNMQVQFLTGSGGGVVVTTGAVSYLAKKFGAGTFIDATIPDAPTLPGFSDAFNVGAGKVRFFGAGEFASGEVGYIGFRVAGSHYGWAEVSAVDGDSFTVYQAAYEDIAGTGIPVGAIPEPSTAVLLVFTGLALIRRRR